MRTLMGEDNQWLIDFAKEYWLAHGENVPHAVMVAAALDRGKEQGKAEEEAESLMYAQSMAREAADNARTEFREGLLCFLHEEGIAHLLPAPVFEKLRRRISEGA